jgi:tetratricopeptide (TPR) repeat protein
VGKTTLARALIETRPANVPLPFWFDFSKKMDATLGDVLEKLAGYMKTPDIANFKIESREAGQEDINRLTGELQKGEPVWLVFDNLEIILDGRHFHDPGIDSLFTALRGSTHQAKIIVTSRTLPLLGNGESLIDVIEEEKQELKGLKTNFAVDFLTKNGLNRVEPEKLEELANGVDGHPLALRLLIELVKEFGVGDTLKDLSMYQRHKVDAMKKLIDKSLLETDHKGNYWLHPLVREFAYDDLEDKIEAHKLAYQYYLSLPLPEKRIKKEDVPSLIEAHYHACIAKEYDKAADIIFDYNMIEDLYMQGSYRTLFELFVGVLPKDHLRDKTLLSSIRNHSIILGNLGFVYRNLGDTKKAIEYYEEALKIAQEIGDRRGEGNWLGYLGFAYLFLGEVRKAIQYYEKALKIAQESLRLLRRGEESNPIL